ncbi:uncharacterized protein V1518DRAFT_423989 [Limtongia smithiae]|uniref:uncharacterized protein n=1 Tax=Limtongia smithiae TaxID=1125753 RepID=UPI0034CD1E60
MPSASAVAPAATDAAIVTAAGTAATVTSSPSGASAQPVTANHHRRGHSSSTAASSPSDSLFSSAIAATNSNISRISKTVAATSSILAGGGSNPYGEFGTGSHYRTMMNDMAPALRKQDAQRRMFSFRNATSLASSRRAAAAANSSNAVGFGDAPALLLSKEMLQDLPESSLSFSLLQGFRATLPENSAAQEVAADNTKKQLVKKSKKSKVPEQQLQPVTEPLTGIPRLQADRKDMLRKLQRIAIRKAVVQQGVREVDARIEQLVAVKNRHLERLAKFDEQELDIEDKIQVLDYRIELLQEDDEVEDEGAGVHGSPNGGVEDTDSRRDESETQTNFSGQSMTVLTLHDSNEAFTDVYSTDADDADVRANMLLQLAVGNGHNNNINSGGNMTGAVEYESDSDSEVDEAFAQDMSASMREAWVSSFLEWERVTTND